MGRRVIFNARDASYPWLWLVAGIPGAFVGAWAVYYEYDHWGADFLSDRWTDATVGFILFGVGVILTGWGSTGASGRRSTWRSTPARAPLRTALEAKSHCNAASMRSEPLRSCSTRDHWAAAVGG